MIRAAFQLKRGSWVDVLSPISPERQFYLSNSSVPRFLSQSTPESLLDCCLQRSVCCFLFRLTMSGFEIVGVVLAIFPIVTEAFKFYAEERGVIKDFYHYQHVLKRISRGLAREQASFSNSCKRFMEDIANQCGVDEEEIFEMMQDPTDPRWREGDLVQEQIFCQKSVQQYLDTVEDMNEELVKIQESIAKYGDDGQVSLLSLSSVFGTKLISYSLNRSIKKLVDDNGRRSSSRSRKIASPSTLKKRGA